MCKHTEYGPCDLPDGHAGHHQHQGASGLYRWDDSGKHLPPETLNGPTRDELITALRNSQAWVAKFIADRGEWGEDTKDYIASQARKQLNRNQKLLDLCEESNDNQE